jgi:two-component system cell cycle response regulator
MKLVSATNGQTGDDSAAKPGGSYLIREEKPVKSFKMFKKVMSNGNSGLCISRTHPNMLQDEYKLGKVPIKWLTTGKPEEYTLAPTLLPKITNVITDFIQNNSKSVVLLEGIEYLIDQNDFKSVLKMVHSINDAVMRGSSIFIMPLDPYILEKKELHILGRDLITVT